MERRRPAFDSEIALLRKSPTAARLLDPDRLERLIARWPQTAEDAAPLRQELDGMLTRALHVGAFIRWAESGSVVHKYPSRAITSP
jgi:hypothetical protein